MEPRFGHDFSRVRVHADGRAAESADAVNALAYTVGRHIVFARGRYEPQIQRGQRLLAHELVHTVQQQMASEPMDQLTVARPADHGEAEARQEAEAVVAPAVPPLKRIPGRSFAIPRLQRQLRPVPAPEVNPPTQERQPGTAGPIVEGAGDISLHAGATMTAESALREVYRQGASRITEEALRMVNNGTPVEEAARWAVAARNDLKAQIRARGSPVTRGLAEARNTRKYGNKVGPSYDDLIREGKTPEDVIGSAGRSSRKVNRIATRLRLAGRLAIGIDIAIVTWEVYEAEPSARLRTLAAGAAGVGGAAAGGWGGAKGGAALGTLFAPGLGTLIGGAIGGIGGALVGGWAGRRAGEAAYEFVEELFTPSLDTQMREIDAAEDARFQGVGR